MTSLPYPPQVAASGVPADSTGVYPHLVGYAPIELGRRVLVAAVDGAIGITLYALITVVSVSGSTGSGTMVAITALAFGYLAAVLWALFARSARLAGVFLGARYVDVRTGRPSGGLLFGKQLLMSLFSGLTLGIAPLVMVFATIQQPLQRNWFDRALNLMLVDTRLGRNPDDPGPALPAPGAWQQGGSHDGLRGHGAGHHGVIQPVVLPEASPAPNLSYPNPAPAADVSPSPYDFGPSRPFGAGPSSNGAITPIVDPGGVIASAPTSGGAPGAPLAPPTAPLTAAAAASVPVAPAVTPVVRDLHSVDASGSDHTILAPHAPAQQPVGLGAFLDDGRQVSLEPPTVLGRNPQAPGSHPDAVAHVVDDPLVSKTHLVLGRDDEGPWVIDLHSTNGVAVAKVPGGEPVRVEAGRKIHLPAGAIVRVGEQTVAIR